MINIAICDDDITVCSELEFFILEFQKQTNTSLTVEIFYSGEELIDYIINYCKFDLIFLDIELGNINGVKVGQFIRSKLEDFITKLVYISSKSQYDRQLFDVQPLHFLEKPIKKEKVIQDIQLTIKILGKENNIFSFKNGKEIYNIPIKDILYFESLNKKNRIVCLNNIYYYYGKIHLIMEKVSNNKFIQPHRSYVVNYQHIILMKSNEMKMVNGDIIPISQGKRSEIRQLYIAFSNEGI